MKFFLIEGSIKHAALMSDDILKEHMAYSQAAMDKGQIVMSGLKEDMSGGVFLMRGESTDVVEAYLQREPLKVHGIQEYRLIPFEPHFISDHIKD